VEKGELVTHERVTLFISSDGGFSQAEFRHLYETTFSLLYSVSYRIVGSEDAAEDICQEAFFKLYERQMRFPNEEEANYWLIRVVKNASINYAKRKERERRAYQKAFRENSTPIPSGEGDYITKETREEIQQALNRLPENLRIVLYLKEYGDLNYKEIGRVLGISEGNVKVRVFRARERLIKELGLLSPEDGKIEEQKDMNEVSFTTKKDIDRATENGKDGEHVS